MTFSEKREMLANNYVLFVGPLLILIAVGIGNHTWLLLGVAATLLVLATINKIAFALRR